MSWTATAFVYSGRLDPSWPVDDSSEEALELLWLSLSEATGGEVATPPRLGYRGCRLLAPDGRSWTAYRRLVTLLDGEAAETRLDPGAEFESRLLASAPAGILPPWAGTDT